MLIEIIIIMISFAARLRMAPTSERARCMGSGMRLERVSGMVEVEGGVEGRSGGVEYRLHRPRLLLLTGFAGAREMSGGADAGDGVNAKKLL